MAKAWAFVGVSNVVEVTSTSHPLVTTGITGLAAGDLLVACISSRIASTTSVTLPTGGAWTLVGEQKANNILSTNAAVPSALMAYAIRGASNPNLTFTHPVAPSVALGRIVAYRNVDQVSPKDTQSAATTATVITGVSVAGLTTTQADDLIVAMTAGGQEAAWSAFNASVPSGASSTASQTGAPTTTWLERADSSTITGVDTSLAIFDAVKTAAGATGQFTATASISAAHSVIACAFKIDQSGNGVGTASGVGTATAVGAALTGTPDAWNIYDKSANITLSNSDKTATLSSSVAAGVRSTQKRTHNVPGKYYFEFLVNNTAGAFSARVGLSNFAQTLTTTTDTLNVGLSDGVIRRASTILGDATDETIVNGDVICCAWNTQTSVGNSAIWVRLNNGDWNNTPTSDPATGVGGLATGVLPDVDYALWFYGTTTASSVTVRTETAEFSYAGPSGFTSWMGEALGPATSDAVGDADGVGTAAATSGAIKETIGTAAGVAVASGASPSATTDAAGAASGIGTASAVGVAFTGIPDAWNAADKSANITLSNSDKTATLSSAVTGGVRSTTKYLNGTEANKFYVEFVLTNAISGFSCQVGIREASAAVNTSAGSTFQCASNSGNIVIGSSTTVGNIGGAPLLDGDVICMAWSPSTERGWFRKNGGLWNNDAAANPATNTNGFDISALNNTSHGLLFLAASSLNGAIVTVRTEAADLTLTAPSGFVSWMGEALGAATTDGVGDADGVGAAAAISEATKETVGTAAGTGTATAGGAATKETAGTAAGVGAATAVSSTAAIVSGAGAASGLGSASGSGAQTATTIATAFGIGAATATGGKIAAAAGTASGLGVATATGEATGEATATTGTAVGIGSANAVSVAIGSAVGAASGLGTATGATEQIAAAIGTASGIGTALGAGVPPVAEPGGGYHYRPDRRPFPVEGYGYGILPQIEGEAHGVVGAVGRSIGALPRFAGQADASAGAAGSSSAQLTVKATALGNAVARGRGSGMIVKFEGAAVGQHDDDEAAIVAWLLAA